MEREIIPMTRDEGMGLAPWGALGGGSFKTAEQRKAGDGRQRPATEAEVKISEKLEAIANRKGTQITSVALAYVMHKTPYVFPIVGGRTVEHLRGNIEALKLHLSEEDIDEIEGAVPFDAGFPNNFLYGLFGAGSSKSHPGDVGLLKIASKFDYVPLPKVSIGV